MTPVLWLLALSGCDDTTFPGGGGGGGPPIGDAEGWCATRAVFAGSCVGCHSASGVAGGLDLETDPHAATVGVTSAAYGVPLVVPGDPDGSLLLRKMEGTQAPGEGSAMPPGTPLDADTVAKVRDWIADGAPDTCDETTTPTVPPGRGPHPAGWGFAENGEDVGTHALFAKLSAGVLGSDGTCLDCHGADLQGVDGLGISCDECHAAYVPGDWRTTCTFCHGDRGGNPSSPYVQAPPEDIDDNADPLTISFPAHRLHIESELHGDWDCVQCHTKPGSILDAGHLFSDDTPGRADLVFAAGQSADGTYDYEAKSCANLYCHGNGQSGNGARPGTVAVDAGPMNCNSCHQGPGSDGEQMSGRHEDHLDEGFDCVDCHRQVINGEGEIIGAVKELHVNGRPTVQLRDGMNHDPNSQTCTGTCHGEQHNGRQWFGD